jgi:hypothetical protein
MSEVTMTVEQMVAELAKLKAENQALQAANAPKERHLTPKVSVKGCLSVYGLGRFPVTLYRGQWEKLIAGIPAIQAFITLHAAELKVKEPV